MVLEDMRVLERCSLSKLAAHPNARLFRQLLEMFRFYLVSHVVVVVVVVAVVVVLFSLESAHAICRIGCTIAAVS